MLTTLPPLPDPLRQTLERDRDLNQHLSSTSISLPEAVVVASAVYGFGLARTMEIGFAHAGSAAAVIAAKLSRGLPRRHIAIDPYQRTHSESRGLDVLRALGYSEHLVWVEDWSERYLPRALASGEKFDFILIDGGHGLGQAMIDAFFSDQILTIGGFIAVDDIYIKSTANSIEYLVKECGCEVVDCRRGALPNPARVAVRAWRGLPRWYAWNMSASCADALALLRKTREYRGGY
jgi:predicted O-methyltransferase YrrM